VRWGNTGGGGQRGFVLVGKWERWCPCLLGKVGVVGVGGGYWEKKGFRGLWGRKYLFHRCGVKVLVG